MSIVANMTPYMLQEIKTTHDDLGCDVESFLDICYINVCVNKKHTVTKINDVNYRYMSSNGITYWDKLDINKQYMLLRRDAVYLDGTHLLDGTLLLDGYIQYDKAFKITSFIKGRLTQLELEEVIYNG